MMPVQWIYFGHGLGAPSTGYSPAWPELEGGREITRYYFALANNANPQR